MKTIKSSLAVILAVFWCLFSLPATAQTTTQLDDASLKAMIEGLGYEAKPLSKGYLLTVKGEGTWTFFMQAVLSPDSTKLGLNANLGSVESPDVVPASKWLGLLASNADIDPSVFYFNRDQKKLYLHRVVDNRNITPAILRTQIDNFRNDIQSTSALWDFAK